MLNKRTFDRMEKVLDYQKGKMIICCSGELLEELWEAYNELLAYIAADEED